MLWTTCGPSQVGPVAGVVVGLSTDPETPFAVVIETVVTPLAGMLSNRAYPFSILAVSLVRRYGASIAVVSSVRIKA